MHITYKKDIMMDLQTALLFELKSFLGRIIFRKKPPIDGLHERLLHVGCGVTTIFDNWINAGFFSGFKPWKNQLPKPEWMLDLRYPLYCDDNVWDGVFSEHTFEHLHYNEVSSLLRELFRTMKRGTWIRITVPDLKKYIDYYLNRNVHENFSQWRTGCEAISSLTQNYGHVSTWDSELMHLFLKESGFSNIQIQNFMKGNDKRLLKDRADRKWETMYMEAQKL